MMMKLNWELSGSNVVTTGEESEDKSTEPETNTKTGDDDEVKPEVEGETNEPEAKKPSFGKMLKSSFQRIFGFKSPSPHPQEHDQDMAKTPEHGADGGDFDNKITTLKVANGGPEVQLEDDNNFESELSGSNVVTTGDESEDQVPEPEYGTETKRLLSLNLKVELMAVNLAPKMTNLKMKMKATDLKFSLKTTTT
ncbi:hypothetical protein BASA60_011539 [Batrachochytrium salamandrivorans]|nr:hypothetical protein BASA60_011539 [Batrachochytrium salamandrivorans]